MQHAADGMSQPPRRKRTTSNSSATRVIRFQANHLNNDVHKILQEAIARCISRRSPSSLPRAKAGRQAGEERQTHSGRKACCCSGGLRSDSSEAKGVRSHSCNAQNRKTRRPEAHQSRRCAQEHIWSIRQAQNGSSFRRQNLIHHQEAAARSSLRGKS